MYYAAVFRTLIEHREVSSLRGAGVVCLPAFEPEWALRLVLDEDGEQYLLIQTEAEEQIWDSDSAEIKVAHRELPFPKDIAESVCDVWLNMLRGARFPDSGWSGRDGVNYHFNYWGPEAFLVEFCGRTWSPEKDTAPGRLVALADALRDFAITEHHGRPVLLRRVEAEVSWFQTSGIG